MSNNRTCAKCGWQWSKKDPRGTCAVCHAFLTEGPCTKCGTYAVGWDYMPEYRMCRSCFNSSIRQTRRINYFMSDGRKVKFYNKRHTRAYEAWLDRVHKAPTTCPTLTESQWLEACAYFNGCAFCGDYNIEAREFFIPFVDGGRYCDWNVLPVCASCAQKVKTSPNQWKRLNIRMTQPAPPDTEQGQVEARFNKILQYLDERMKKHGI